MSASASSRDEANWPVSSNRFQRWARADLGHAVACLRAAHRDHEATRARGAALRAHVRARFSEDVVGEALLRFLGGSG